MTALAVGLRRNVLLLVMAVVAVGLLCSVLLLMIAVVAVGLGRSRKPMLVHMIYIETDGSLLFLSSKENVETHLGTLIGNLTPS